MARKPKIDIEFVSKDCGEKQEPNKDKSSDNWNVYVMTCLKCGGEVDMKIKE